LLFMVLLRHSPPGPNAAKGGFIERIQEKVLMPKWQQTRLLEEPGL